MSFMKIKNKSKRLELILTKTHKKDAGITLVAIVVTIIVMLILLGITIGTITDNNGVIKHAQGAKSLYEQSQEIEGQSVQDYREKLKQSTGRETTANRNEMMNNPGSYYGKTVKYSSDDVNDWKVFYVDQTNIFLIESDFLDISKVQTSSTGLSTLPNKRVYWNSTPTFYEEWSRYKSSFLHNRYTLNSSKQNSKVSSILLNTDCWSNLVNNTYADLAIGGPTVEMWTESWNNLYPNDKLFCNNTNANGYLVGTNETATLSEVSKNVMNQKEGYLNDLYFPFRESGSTKVDRSNYLLASPSGQTVSQSTSAPLSIWSDGALGYCLWYTSSINWTPSLRPIVRLKSNVSLVDSNDSNYDFELKVY